MKTTENPNESELVLPVLYRRPAILDAIRFGKKKLASATDFSFAREENSVPVTVVEFPIAQRHFPIVFTQEQTPLPMVVLGAKHRLNEFVDSKGRWRLHTYVPAYIRRYPFMFLENNLAGGDVQYVLCIDEESPLVSERRGEPLYDEKGAPTPVIRRATEMCAAFQGHYNLTVEFGRALKDHDLIVPNEAGARIAPAGSMPLRGFSTIDETRFKNLDGDTLADRNKRGWLQLVYAHLLSLLNWHDLFATAFAGNTPKSRNKSEKPR